ncbi:exodeoxyribonuclease V subunit beta [Utexia brackfieldae]|uniref:exodeoxyribonuclease V subunit beta n=1 Tax=Utexia brackfieldae TaxID=3074108 RepID=UPI00370D4125
MAAPRGLISSDAPQILSPMRVPLVGRSLIEASAGTGKTYTLSLLYLRLLLGIGEQAYPRALTVDQILVVTFTQAATEELRYRIRENIHQLRIACLRGFHTDPLYQDLLALIDDRHYAAQTLLFAEQQMDEAAIYTIHGFCQRVLNTHAFESGVLFEQTLIQDESQLRLQVTQDFWRRFFYPLSTDLARVILQIWPNPSALLSDITRYLYHDSRLSQSVSQQPIAELMATFHHDKIAKITQVKLAWQQYRAEIEPTLMASDINKRSYSSRNVANWLMQIDRWADTPTQDYQLADKLSQFSQTVLTEKSQQRPPTHRLFELIDRLCRESFNLKQRLLLPIVDGIKHGLRQEKLQRAEMGFDDLLAQLHQALILQQQGGLSDALAKRYPVAMIDEFQDTDPMQYQIFDRIYMHRQQTGLLFIGDPKQAIYGFRGADIFTYIQAKSNVDNYFTMETNWRSSAEMVTAVNQLFQQQHDPFIFSQIPFMPIKSAARNQTKQIEVKDNTIAAMQCYFLPESVSTVNDYQRESAAYCAQQICQWLCAGEQQQAWLIDSPDVRRPIGSADIAILVRTSHEAEIIQQALTERGIRSVYFSNRRSVFESPQAKELLWLLQAIEYPENMRYVHTALATQLLAGNMADMDNYHEDQDRFEDIIEEFQQYRDCWRHFGVLAMLRQIMARRQIAENILAQADGERILTDMMHLGELLQTASEELDSQPALLRWLTKQIQQPDPNLENQQQRLESDENLVKIMTIHKSKGLEYPIVFLPFICHHRASDKSSYHDRSSYALTLASPDDAEAKTLIEEERLAEDLRLLYVALTRAIYYCGIGVAGLKARGSQNTQLHQTALGYLVQQGQEGDYSLFQQQVMQLSVWHSESSKLHDVTPMRLSTPQAEPAQIAANQFKRQLADRWRVTSYSGLQQSYGVLGETPLVESLVPVFDVEARVTDSVDGPDTDLQLAPAQSTSSPLSMHVFPKGAHVGTLLHSLMETIDFTQPDKESVLPPLLTRLNLSADWYEVLSFWLDDVLHTPLSDDGLTLSQISHDQKLIELQFYLPIRHLLSAKQLDQLCKTYDPLSQQCRQLDFADVEGMLKGFIDLVFEWQGRFYILDYKSNWLGDNLAAYSPDAIKQAMCEHRYDLQYQLYTLALHRYLRQRIADYDYECHFGGIYYLFFRGMTPSLPQNGLFFHRPQIKFIESLDQLFGTSH